MVKFLFNLSDETMAWLRGYSTYAGLPMAEVIRRGLDTVRGSPCCSGLVFVSGQVCTVAVSG